jgi:hypothetical protein
MRSLTVFVPDETDPGGLRDELITLRNETLAQADFASAVMLSHVIKWFYYLDAAYREQIVHDEPL